MSDEHNAGVMGCAGNDIVRTPHLDALARRGVLFDRCYCNAPLCVPSRLSFTSGKYSSRVNAWSNNSWLPSDDIPSLPRVMSAAGYEPLLCGKMHYDRTRRYGFRELIPSWGNGVYKTGKVGRRKPDDLAPRPGISTRFRDIGIGESHVTGHDRAIGRAAVKFLSERKADSAPFFLLAGFIAPHFPLVVPAPYGERYRGKVPLPKIPDGHLASQPLNYKHLRIGFNDEEIPEDTVRKARELYFGLVEWVDGEIGKVLDALQSSEVADSTVVIYTADHGENMGEHGLWWKNCMYDHAARVPLIVSWPARWKGGQRRTGICSLLDVVKMIADLGGATVPEDWDGDSLLPLVENQHARWKDFAVSEYYAHNVASGFAMIRSGKYKYVYHAAPDKTHPAQRELYDLERDPGEFDNLADIPRYRRRIRRLHEALVQEIGERPDATDARCRPEITKGYGRPPKPQTKQS